MYLWTRLYTNAHLLIRDYLVKGSQFRLLNNTSDGVTLSASSIFLKFETTLKMFDIATVPYRTPIQEGGFYNVIVIGFLLDRLICFKSPIRLESFLHNSSLCDS